MTSKEEPDQEQILTELRQHKHEAERLRKLYELHREDTRASVLAAVTEFGVSVVRAATEAGIDRRTVTTWLTVHNELQKELRKARE